MGNKDAFFVRSSGRRIEFYAELGSYFRPDGKLNEPAFQRFIRRSVTAATATGQKHSITADQWLTAYLENVFDYLEEKDLHQATLRLFELAVEEATKLGIAKLSISPKRMCGLLELAGIGADSKSAKTLDPDEKKAKIFEAALLVFGQRGYHEATMDEIASCSQVAKGTLYRYFKSKEELLNRLLVEKSRHIVDQLSEIFSPQGDVLTQIKDFVEHWVLFIEQNHVLYRLIQTEGVTSRSGKGAMFYEHLITSLPMVKERIASMNQERKVKIASFHTVAYGILGFIDGVVHRWRSSGMTYPLRDEIPVILEVLFNGFATDTAHKTYYHEPEEVQTQGS